jgi:glucose-1-phosphate thymidylyltransferase
MREAAPDAALTPAQAAAAEAGLKAMMPVGAGAETRPFLDYVLASLRRAGCTHACLVVAPDHDAVRRRYRDEVHLGLDVTLACQDEPTGTAHAVLAARPAVGGSPFLVVNADNLYPVPVLRALVELDTPGLPGFTVRELTTSSQIPTAQIASFALLDVDAHGWLRGISEKPGAGRLRALGEGAVISMNAWRFDARIFEACREVPTSARGEHELPEAVGLAIARGVMFRVIPAHGAVLDLSRRTDVARVSARLAGMDAEP